MNILLCLLSFFIINAANISNLSDSTIYKNMIVNQKFSKKLQKPLEGFLENTKYIPDKKAIYNDKDGFIILREYTVDEVDYLLGQIHNILLSTLYHCDANAPISTTFEEALDGMHTPNSENYAAFIHSALEIRGVNTEFFKAADNHYGIYYKDKKTGRELYWSIFSHLDHNGAACNADDFADVYNKYKEKTNKEIAANDITIMSSEEFLSTDFSNNNEEDSYTQKILSPKDANNEEIVADGVEIEQDATEAPAVTEPVTPLLGIAAIKEYNGSVDLFNTKSGLLFADDELSDSIKYSTIINSESFKNCISLNNIKDKKMILMFKLEQDGSVKNLSIDNIADESFQSCISELWTTDIKVDPRKIKEPVKILQIVKL